MFELRPLTPQIGSVDNSDCMPGFRSYFFFIYFFFLFPLKSKIINMRMLGLKSK